MDARRGSFHGFNGKLTAASLECLPDLIPIHIIMSKLACHMVNIWVNRNISP